VFRTEIPAGACEAVARQWSRFSRTADLGVGVPGEGATLTGAPPRLARRDPRGIVHHVASGAYERTPGFVRGQPKEVVMFARASVAEFAPLAPNLIPS
jgi:hypothetical protein